jgi:hypothetical protein
MREWRNKKQKYLNFLMYFSKFEQHFWRGQPKHQCCFLLVWQVFIKMYQTQWKLATCLRLQWCFWVWTINSYFIKIIKNHSVVGLKEASMPNFSFLGCLELRLQLSSEVGAGVETKADQKSESNKRHRGGYSLLCLHNLLDPQSTPVEIFQLTWSHAKFNISRRKVTGWEEANLYRWETTYLEIRKVATHLPRFAGQIDWPYTCKPRQVSGHFL